MPGVRMMMVHQKSQVREREDGKKEAELVANTNLVGMWRIFTLFAVIKLISSCISSERLKVIDQEMVLLCGDDDVVTHTLLFCCKMKYCPLATEILLLRSGSCTLSGCYLLDRV